MLVPSHKNANAKTVMARIVSAVSKVKGLIQEQPLEFVFFVLKYCELLFL